MTKCKIKGCDNPVAGRVLFECGHGCCEKCGVPMCRDHLEKTMAEEKHASRIEWFDQKENESARQFSV